MPWVKKSGAIFYKKFMGYIQCSKSVYIRDLLIRGATNLSGPGPPQFQAFMILLRHTTFGKTLLDEWSARRRVLYLTTHNTRKGH